MNDIPNLTFHEGLPDRQLLEELFKDNDYTLLMLDDLASKIVTSEEILHLFTVMSHHRFITVLYICQNLYQPGRYARTISLNCANFVLFRNPRDTRQIMTFASQLLPGKTRYFMDSYLKATTEIFSYLLIVISIKKPDDRKYMLRTGIFPGDTCTVFLPA